MLFRWIFFNFYRCHIRLFHSYFENKIEIQHWENEKIFFGAGEPIGEVRWMSWIYFTQTKIEQNRRVFFFFKEVWDEWEMHSEQYKLNNKAFLPSFNFNPRHCCRCLGKKNIGKNILTRKVKRTIATMLSNVEICIWAVAQIYSILIRYYSRDEDVFLVYFYSLLYITIRLQRKINIFSMIFSKNKTKIVFSLEPLNFVCNLKFSFIK